MKIVYSWLKDFVDINVPVEELADALTAAGLEVASFDSYKIPAGVIVGKVLETEKHPNADKLTLCKVDSGSEVLNIVCGAPNVRADIKVALATIGTAITPDFVIKKSKIRGTESFGMLCSERELGLSDDHDGIIELPESFRTGDALSVYYPDDAVIEIEITPDRGDCLSMIGVAREVTARYGLPLKNTVPPVIESETEQVESFINVENEAPQQCPRYCGKFIKGVKIQPSPYWMQRRLKLAGVRPINNVVDVTNYILLHFGQPMHSFDYSRIEGKKIVIRHAENNQIFKTLDDSERKLLSSDLLICDSAKPVALAGIMGGADSQILDTTTDVFLECAFFDPVTVRKTSKRLGLSTDSSYRFERGVDPDSGLISAVEYAAELIRQTAGGTVAKGRIDRYPSPLEPRMITIRPGRASKILGMHFKGEQVRSFLVSLGIKCSDNLEAIECTIPLFRHDLAIEEDLIEEVGRLYGYDNIIPAEMASISLNTPLPQVENMTDTIRKALAFSGLREIITNSMISQKMQQLLTPEKKPVAILNPLNPDMALMQTTLSGNMLGVLSYNLNHKNSNNRYFEIGKAFEYSSSGEYRERTVLGILVQGDYYEKTWNVVSVQSEFYVLKGIIEAFCVHIGAGSLTFTKQDTMSVMFNCEQARIMGENISGFMGRVSDKVSEAFDLKTTVFYAELDITDLINAPSQLKHYHSLPKFPAAERDFSFVLPDQLSVSLISDEIFSISPLIESVYPFDVYRGEKIGSGQKSVTFSVKIRSAEKTLTDKETETICSSIIKRLQEKYNITLRT
ncbi:MAG: phenylalanine--tRNA ligase subunit beta [Chitinispirillaceae bacterium]|nr:phenylalanine--tRNA ligase subunit beta [Chitinispirillaceae bacterium]